MFVCICRAVTRSHVLATVVAGAETLDAVEAACGAGADCGTCRREIADMLRACPFGDRVGSEAA